MRIAVDAMGGDLAPQAIVEGAARASLLPDYNVLLVGRETQIGPILERYPHEPGRIEIVHASEVIEMGDSPAKAVLRRKDSSLVVCGDLVKRGDAQAFVSAGNSGAGMAVATMRVGRIPGIDRPAIAAILPSKSGRVVMLDAGANIDCSVQNLVQFGTMGSIYAEEVLGIRRPRVGLLNIGEEESKGNDLTREALVALRGEPVNFIGNVEGRDIFLGGVDVVVCDGFVGNVVLKAGEGAAELLIHLVKKELSAHPLLKIPAALLAPALRRIKRRTDYEEVGGAPLLGVQGVCIISHGRSNAGAITNAIRAAGEAVKHGVVERIRSQAARTSGLAAAS